MRLRVETTLLYRWIPAVALPVLVTAAATPIFSRHTSAAIAMVYLLGVLLIGLSGGRGPAGLAAVISSLSFNFFLSPPQWTFRIESVADTLTFVALLGVGLVVAELSARVAEQARVARLREDRALRLANYTEELVTADTESAVAAVAERFIGEVLGTKVVLLFLSTMEGGQQQNHEDIPVIFRDRVLGLIRVKQPIGDSGVSSAVSVQLGDYLRPLSLALERLHFSQVANREAIRAHGEELRNTLLAGLSHDLRTPLSTLMAASSTLLSGNNTASVDERGLIRTIDDQTRYLAKLVTNLLEMTKLTAGLTRMHPEWVPVEEIIGSARRRLIPPLQEGLRLSIAPEHLLVHVDALLFEQLLVNLLENSVIHSGTGEPIELHWTAWSHEVPGFTMEVRDRGVGVSDIDKLRIFDAFERGARVRNETGIGLGLALCKAIAVLHGGSIEVHDRDGGGAVFRVALPQPNEKPPMLPPEVIA